MDKRSLASLIWGGCGSQGEAKKFMHSTCVCFFSLARSIPTPKRHLGVIPLLGSHKYDPPQTVGFSIHHSTVEFKITLLLSSRVTPANQTKERPVHELFPGANRNKSSMWIMLVVPRKNTRDAETTILIKFAFWRGLGGGKFTENCPKTLFFLGNSMTMKFGHFTNCIVRNLLSFGRLLTVEFKMITHQVLYVFFLDWVGGE